MEIVLGVSMTPTAVRMVLVEGEKADGATVDHDTFHVGDAADSETPGAAGQVIAAILGTRESAAEGAHRLVCTGVAWSDHTAAAELRDALHAHGISDVALVSELHAASALAQAVGRAGGYERTALIFVEDGPAVGRATLAVVQTADGAVVKVWSGDPAAVAEMVAALESLEDRPQAVFVAGAGLDTVALKDRIAGATTLPVHAPQDADLALARGAALAAANSPRFEAETVGLAPAGDFETAAGATQAAPAGYMAPLGYSAVPDDPDGDVLDLIDDPRDADPVEAPERKPFLLVGSALSTVFVVGVAALVISLAVSIRPTADQRPAPAPAPAVPNSEVASPAAAKPAPAPPPQTIQAPVPVVQVAPRTVYVTPAQKAPAPMPAAVPEMAPAPVAPVPEQIALTPEPAAPPPAPIAPAPIIPPVVVAPIIPPWLRTPVMPQFPNGLTPVQSNPVPAQTDSTAPASPPATGAQQSPAATGAQQSPRSQSGGRDSAGGGRDDSRSGEGRTHSNPLWPEFPMPFG